MGGSREHDVIGKDGEGQGDGKGLPQVHKPLEGYLSGIQRGVSTLFPSMTFVEFNFHKT